MGHANFLTQAAIGVLWSQVPVSRLASVTGWALNVRPTRTGALGKGKGRKEQVRICSTLVEHGASALAELKEGLGPRRDKSGSYRMTCRGCGRFI